MKDRDFRQYSLMLEHLSAVPQTVNKLGQVVNALKSLVTALENTDPDWKQQFQSEWWTLEEIYAFNLSNSREHLTEQERLWINEAIANLTNLIRAKVSKTY